jgi:hypothetical protein
MAAAPLHPDFADRTGRLVSLIRDLQQNRLFQWLHSLGLLPGSIRFVLTIGDEGGSLVKFQGRRVVDALFADLGPEGGPEAFLDYLEQDRSAPVLVSVDVLEQMYREERLPRVGRFDRAAVIRRRLDVAFPHDRLKAAVPLGHAKADAESMLFTALPVTETIQKWIGFLESLRNPITGFCLLPLESAGLAARLGPSVAGETRRVWRALVTQQATSGIRQIFESNGNLIVTRLTQLPPGELSAEAGAMLIERELRSSISYIKRLGYSELDRLDLVVLANAATCAAVENRTLPVTSLTTLSPRQAGETLGFGAVGPEDGACADVLHAQVLAFKRHPKTSLPTERLKEKTLHETLFKWAFVATALFTLFSVFYLGSLASEAFDTLTTADQLAVTVTTETQGLAGLRQKAASFDVPIDEVARVAGADTAFAKAENNPAELFRAIAAALTPANRVVKITFTAPSPSFLSSSPGAPPPPAPRGGKAAPELLYEVAVSLQLAATTADPPERAIRESRELRDRLAGGLPGHEVSLTQMPLGASKAQVLEGSAGATTAAKAASPVVVDYLIRKRL